MELKMMQFNWNERRKEFNHCFFFFFFDDIILQWHITIEFSSSKKVICKKSLPISLYTNIIESQKWNSIHRKLKLFFVATFFKSNFRGGFCLQFEEACIDIDVDGKSQFCCFCYFSIYFKCLIWKYHVATSIQWAATQRHPTDCWQNQWWLCVLTQSQCRTAKCLV